MDTKKCPQCCGPVNKGDKRLVLDTCGHYKCRKCLLDDDTSCRACVQQTEQSTVIQYEEKQMKVNEKPKKKPHRTLTIPNHIKIISSTVDVLCLIFHFITFFL